MSSTVDNRVVSMKFDNASFEKNVSTSMHTLTNLNEKLKMSEATKGLQGINDQASKMDLSGFQNGVESVSVKFSALQVMATTALANITNSAVEAGKKLVSAFTIDPIKTGFQEYETQINAIQTILANTSSAGTTLEQVKGSLNELNLYADKTIYNFTEMTRNIGTFTAAGVDLKTSTSAIKGIANLAAVSGSNAQQASTAMYQLSQAIAAGKVGLQDWNSVVNAGMGGKVFQNALKETAKAMGKTVDESKSFRESIGQNGSGWLTSDVLLKTLDHFTGDMSAAEIKAEGFSDAQTQAIVAMGKTASDAATKVKTFSQLFDILKEAAQSGWTQSWEYIVGDFDEAKSSLTDLSNIFGNLISDSANKRNDALSSGLTSGWSQLMAEGIDNTEDFQNCVEKTAESNGVHMKNMITDDKSFQEVLKELLSTGKVSSKDLLSSLDGISTKYSNMTEEQKKSAGVTDDQVKKLNELNQKFKDGTLNMDDFTKKMMQDSGRANIFESIKNVLSGVLNIIGPVKKAFEEIFPPITGEQIYNVTEKLRELTEQFKEVTEGNTTVARSFKGLFAIMDIVRQVFVAVAKAIIPLFGYAGDLSGGILDVTASMGDWLTCMDEFLKKSGFFDEISQGISNALLFIKSTVESVVNAIENKFNDFVSSSKTMQDVLGILSTVQDKIANMSDYAQTGEGIFTKLFNSQPIQAMSSYLNGLYESIKGIALDIENVVINVISTISSIISKIDFGSLFNGGIFAGISSGFSKLLSFFDDISQKAEGASEPIKKFTSSMSNMSGTLKKTNEETEGSKPSFLIGLITFFKEAFDVIGKAVNGIIGFIGKLSSKIVTFISGIDAGKIKEIFAFINASLLTAQVGGVTKIIFDIDKLTKTFKNTLSSVSDSLKTFQKSVKVDNLRKIAGSILMLAAALVIIALIPKDKLATSLAGIGTLFGGLIATLVVMSKTLAKNTAPLKSAASAMIGISVAILILSVAMKSLSSLDWGQVARGSVCIGVLCASITIMAKVLSTSKDKIIEGCGGLIAVASAILIMSFAFKQFKDMNWQEMAMGLVGIAAITASLIVFMKMVGDKQMDSGAKIALLALAAAFVTMAKAMKIIGTMSPAQFIQGLAGILVMFGMMMTFMEAVQKQTVDIMPACAGLLVLGAAMLVLSGAIAILGALPIDNIIQGMLALGASLAIISITVQSMPDNLPTIASGVLIMGAAMLVLSGAIAILGAMSPDKLAIGIIALGAALVTMSLALTLVSDLGTDGLIGAASLLVLATALAVLAVPLVILSAIPLKALCSGLIALAGALAILMAFGALVGIFDVLAVGLLVLGASVALLGVGALAAGKGLLAISEGLLALSAIGPVAAASIVATMSVLIAGFLAIIPSILTAIGQGVIQVCNMLIQMIPKLVQTVVVIVAAIVAGLVTLIPTVVAGVMQLIISILQVLAENVPVLVASAVQLVVAFLEGIAQGIPQIIQAGVDVIAAFITGIGQAALQLVELAFTVMITFINGLANCIDTNTPLLIEAMNRLMDSLINAAILVLTNSIERMKERGKALMDSGFIQGIKDKFEDAKNAIGDLITKILGKFQEKFEDFKNAGKNIIDGLIQGIKDKFEDAVSAASELGNKILNSAKEALGIASPSKEFAKIGRWSDLGLAKGLTDYASYALRAASEVGDGAIDAMQSSFGNISNVITGDIDLDPVIRPVLDLTDVTNGAKQIGSMFANQKVGVSGANGQNGGTVDSNGKTFSFVQNNYSPKALSRTEIYRQTKNQFSAMKGAVNNA